MDRRKAPHWVILSGYDEHCLYVNDPDLQTDSKNTECLAVDCQQLPIAKDDFSAMSQFGSNRLRTAVIISKREKSKISTTPDKYINE